MAKKDFKSDNPALAFITMSEEQETITSTDTSEFPKKTPEGYKFNPLYIEKKSKRVQLLMQPSIAESAKKLAQVEGLSMNELVSLALQEYIKNHKK